MRRNPTKAELEYIPNVNYKRIVISQNYIEYGNDCDCQDYLMAQLEVNPKLLAWIFDDLSLVGQSYLALSCDKLEAFNDFYNSLSIYDD